MSLDLLILRRNLGRPIYETVTSAAGGASAITSTVAAGRVRVVTEASLTHDDATDRHLLFYKSHAVSGVFIGLLATRQGGGAAMPASRHFCIPRHTIIHEGWRLVGEADAIGVANTVTIRVEQFEISLEELRQFPFPQFA